MLALLIGGIFMLFGLPAILIARTAFAKDRAIARWPRAPGRITSARVESRSYKSRDRQGYYSDYTAHTPIVQFTYTVDGRELQGDRLARVVESSNIKPDLSRYSPGQEVLVYYDPSAPETAYLELHRSIGAVILAAMGGLFVAIGLLVIILVNFA